MSVTVDISPAICRTAAGKRIRAEVEGHTVGECLRALSSSVGGLECAVFENDQQLKRYMSVFVNGKNVYPDELGRRVTSGDKVHIMVVSAGG